MTALSTLARGSVLARTINRGADRLRTAVNASRVGRTTRTVLAPLRSIPERTAAAETGSVPARDTAAARTLRGSTLAAVVRRRDASLRSAATGSTLRRAAGTVVAVARNSRGYRWLTAEPDPEVVVIDLRRTWSVGPPLAVVDRIVDAIVPGLEGATAVRAFEDVADVVRRRPIAIASALVLGALASSLLASLVAGDPSRGLLAGQIAVAAVATLGLRSRATLDDLRTTTTARLLVAVLEPPDPPSEDAEGSATEFGDAESGGEPAGGPSDASADGPSDASAEKTPDEDEEREPR